MPYQLAQLNIAKMKYSLDHPVMRDFVDALDTVNGAADDSPGFVWRLKADDGNATQYQIYNNPLYLVNMSVWTSVDALKAFIGSTTHAPIMARRAEWFEKMDSAYSVLWWVEAGHQPTVAEAQEKLDLLRVHGPSAEAFSFGRIHPPPTAANSP